MLNFKVNDTFSKDVFVNRVLTTLSSSDAGTPMNIYFATNNKKVVYYPVVEGGTPPLISQNIDGTSKVILSSVEEINNISITGDSNFVLYKTGIIGDIRVIPIEGGDTKIVYQDARDYKLTNSELIVVKDQNGQLFSVPIGGGPTITLSDPGILSYELTNDFNYVVFVDSSRHLYSVPVTGGPRVLLYDTDSVSNTFEISPDDSYVVFKTLSNDVLSVPLLGGAVQTLYNSVSDFKVSEDSLTVVIRDSMFHLYSVPIESGSVTTLYDSAGAVIYDIKDNVVYFSITVGKLYSVPIEGGSATLLYDSSFGFTRFKFASDNYIVFVNNSNLYSLSTLSPSQVNDLSNEDIQQSDFRVVKDKVYFVRDDSNSSIVVTPVSRRVETLVGDNGGQSSGFPSFEINRLQTVVYYYEISGGADSVVNSYYEKNVSRYSPIVFKV
jgi:hypothetical protein